MYALTKGGNIEDLFMELLLTVLTHFCVHNNFMGFNLKSLSLL